MIGKFRHVFDSLRQEHGEWTLFAVLQRPWRAASHWGVVAAAAWLPQGRLRDLDVILGKLNAVSTPEERTDLGLIRLLHRPADITAAINVLLNGRAIDRPVGLVRRKNLDFMGRRLHRAYVWAANPSPTAASLPTV